MTISSKGNRPTKQKLTEKVLCHWKNNIIPKKLSGWEKVVLLKKVAGPEKQVFLLQKSYRTEEQVVLEEGYRTAETGDIEKGYTAPMQNLVLLFYTPWKHQKAFRFSDVFRVYRKATSSCNRLKTGSRTTGTKLSLGYVWQLKRKV